MKTPWFFLQVIYWSFPSNSQRSISQMNHNMWWKYKKTQLCSNRKYFIRFCCTFFSRIIHLCSSISSSKSRSSWYLSFWCVRTIDWLHSWHWKPIHVCSNRIVIARALWLGSWVLGPTPRIWGTVVVQVPIEFDWVIIVTNVFCYYLELLASSVIRTHVCIWWGFWWGK